MVLRHSSLLAAAMLLGSGASVHATAPATGGYVWHPPAGTGPPYVWHGPNGGGAGVAGGATSGAASATTPAATGSDGTAAATGPAAASAAPLSWAQRAQDGTFSKIGWPTAPPAGSMPPQPSHPSNPTMPPAPPANYISFMAIADWGGQDMWPMTTVAQTQCAAAMAKLASDLVHPTFVVSAGDNFYESGIKGEQQYCCFLAKAMLS